MPYILCIIIKPHISLAPFVRSNGTLYSHLTGPLCSYTLFPLYYLVTLYWTIVLQLHKYVLTTYLMFRGRYNYYTFVCSI